MYRSIKITHGLLAGILAFSGMALTPAAQASTLVQVRSKVVTYGDLNLGTTGGDKALLKRIDRAAVKACGGYPDGPDRGAYQRFNACHADAMSSAVRSVNNESVSRLYDRDMRTRNG